MIFFFPGFPYIRNKTTFAHYDYMFYFRMTSLSIRNITRVGTRNLFLQLLNLDLNEDVSYLTTTEKLSYKKLHKEFTCKLQLTSKAQYPSTLIFLFPFFLFFSFSFFSHCSQRTCKAFNKHRSLYADPFILSVGHPP